MVLPLDKNDKYFTGSHIFCLIKICFIRYHQPPTFLWKTKRKARVEIIEDFQKNIGGGVYRMLF